MREVTFKAEDEGDGTYEGQLGPVFVYDPDDPDEPPAEVGWMSLAAAEEYARAEGLAFSADAPTREEWDAYLRWKRLPLWKKLLGRDS